jgi:GDPmannose 4,6-dehydratase
MVDSKVALITGVNGQDGSYLAELLVSKGYHVHGTKRRSSTVTTERLKNLYQSRSGTDLDFKIQLHYADMTDSSSLNRIIDEVKPDEVYNLAAQSHVAVSFEEPEYTANTDALGTLRLLESIRRTKKSDIKFYQASTSELFGGEGCQIYNEDSLINPRSPYAAAKAYAYYITKQYREAYGIFAVNGILFNHESSRRADNFVTKKIIKGIKKIINNEISHLVLGNLDSSRDWGHAIDYVNAMWLMMNSEIPRDYVVASGEAHTIKEFIQIVFEEYGYKVIFEGHTDNQCGIISEYIESGEDKKIKIGSKVIISDKRYYRPLEVDYLQGDSKKIRLELGWKPKYSFRDLIKEMIRNG